jgi:hypothetical protein
MVSSAVLSVIIYLIGYFSLNISHLVVFAAKDLRPYLISPFILLYGQHVLVEGISLSDFKRRFLPTSSIGRHTDIVYIFKEEGKTQSFRYTWTHHGIRPWGHDLPVQCHGCWRIKPWISINNADSSCLFACRGCSKKLKFSPPEKVKWLGAEVSGGRWMVVAE